MAKAHQSPTATTKQTHYVTHHALDRIRERSEPAAHLTDYALCRVIDDAVVQAQQHAENIYAVQDQNDPAELVHVQTEHMDGLTLRGPMFALLKNNSVGDSSYKKAVVTILTEPMARKYYGTYIGAAGFSNTMASQLKDLDIVPSPATPKPPPKAAEPFFMVLEKGENLVQMRGTQSEVTDWLLRNPTNPVEVLRCFPVQVKITVELA